MTYDRINRLELELLVATNQRRTAVEDPRTRRRLNEAVAEIERRGERIAELERLLDSSRRVAAALMDECAACPDLKHHTEHVYGAEGDDE